MDFEDSSLTILCQKDIEAVKKQFLKVSKGNDSINK
jgi:hypothetical protein